MLVCHFNEESQNNVYPKSSAAMMKNPTAKPVKMRMATRSMLSLSLLMMSSCLPMVPTKCLPMVLAR